MASVSLTMIVRDEAPNLGPCLTPVRRLVDEIVVVDTGSRDETVAVAKALGARVFHFPWCDDFSAARNEALEHAQGDWALILDADDRLLPAEINKLRALLDALGDEHVGYVMNQASVAIDGGLADEVEHVRLFRRRSDVRWRYRVHEQILPAILETGGNAQRTDIRLAHLGYVDVSTVAKKAARNLALIELDCASHPLDPFPNFYRALTFAELGRHTEAIVALELCRALIPPSSPLGRSMSLALVQSLRAEGRSAEALTNIRAARYLLPDDPALCRIEAEMLIETGDISAAALVLAGCVDCDQPDLSVDRLRIQKLYGETLLALGHYEAAEDVGRDLTTARPAFGPGWLVLVDALLAQGRVDDVTLLVGRLERTRGAAGVGATVRETLHLRQHETQKFTRRTLPWS